MSVENKKNKLFTKRYIIILVITAIITLFVSLYLISFAMVQGNSMQPTINSGDILLVDKVSSRYERFDVVIIEVPGDAIIKRIIALPGETVQIRDGLIHINGNQIDDVVDIQMEFAGTAFEPLTLKEGEYFVLGDNRNDSKDSRYKDIGTIREDQIVGRAMFSIIPPKILKQ
jgi:signal peptidase I